ncbi:hypothetical protein [Geodermatophilus sp. SYSU D00766]
MSYVEPGGSRRPVWLAAAALAVLGLLDGLLPGPGLPVPVWALTVVVVLGVAAALCSVARRAWTVRVGGRGPDGALTVGRERVPLADVDAAHLRAVREGTAGVDAGAPVLGGGWSLPRGRTGLPLRLTDGRTVLVPTRDPAALTGALLAAVPAAVPASGTSQAADPHAPDGRSRDRGTLGP